MVTTLAFVCIVLLAAVGAPFLVGAVTLFYDWLEERERAKKLEACSYLEHLTDEDLEFFIANNAADVAFPKGWLEYHKSRPEDEEEEWESRRGLE